MSREVAFCGRAVWVISSGFCDVDFRSRDFFLEVARCP
jgi:hypothetical protein